jgi:hypothetical protein
MAQAPPRSPGPRLLALLSGPVRRHFVQRPPTLAAVDAHDVGGRPDVGDREAFRRGQPAGPALLPVDRGTCLGARGSGDCLGLAGRLRAHRWAVSRRLAGSHLTCPMAYQAGTTSLLVSVDGTTHPVEAPGGYRARGRRVDRSPRHAGWTPPRQAPGRPLSDATSQGGVDVSCWPVH